MTFEEELWAVALAGIRTRGNDASLFVAMRIGALAVDGDTEGVAVWRQVAANMDELMQASGRPC